MFHRGKARALSLAVVEAACSQRYHQDKLPTIHVEHEQGRRDCQYRTRLNLKEQQYRLNFYEQCISVA